MKVLVKFATNAQALATFVETALLANGITKRPSVAGDTVFPYSMSIEVGGGQPINWMKRTQDDRMHLDSGNKHFLLSNDNLSDDNLGPLQELLSFISGKVLFHSFRDWVITMHPNGFDITTTGLTPMYVSDDLVTELSKLMVHRNGQPEATTAPWASSIRKAPYPDIPKEIDDLRSFWNVDTETK